MSLRYRLRAIASWIPMGLRRRMEIARRLEMLLQLRQGKGWGAETPEEEVEAILALLPMKDAVVFDVGARFGEWTQAAIRRAGSRIGKVYCFDPSEENHQILMRVAPQKVTAVKAAVSDRSGEATLFSNAPSSGLASLHQRRLDHFGLIHEAVGVTRIVSLDDFTREAGIDRIDFLKLDVEGHELAVLHGAEGLLTAGRIGALGFEFGGCNIDSRTFFQDYWYLLSGFGFDVYRIVPGAKLFPILGYSEDLETFRTTNYVAVRRRAG